MDEFLKEINANIFWKYIKAYDFNENMQVKVEDKSVIIKTAYSHSQINYYNMQLFEFKVSNTYLHTDEFYLHFQMKNMKHALELFNEMLEIIQTLVNRPQVKILLSCSGGLTTGFFAMKLNECAKLLDKDFKFEAVAFNKLIETAENYDIILLAPQISYQHASLQEQLPNKIVLKIPTQVFAKYDVSKLIDLIEKVQVAEYKKEHEVLTLGEITCKHGEILTLVLIRNSLRVHIGYRLFDRNNKVLEDGEIIKNHVTIEDIFDIVDTMTLKHTHIDIISIATPGIINDGIVDVMKLSGMIDGTDLKKAFGKDIAKRLSCVMM